VTSGGERSHNEGGGVRGDLGSRPSS
jgi:hypothetical protein